MEHILNRFLRYVQVDTQSNEESESQPSTSKQLNLLSLLTKELNELGVEASLDEYGYVMGRIPSNVDADVPAVGFIAHVDTAPDASGENVKPQIISNYDGSDIPLKGVSGLALKTSEFPELLAHKGETIITTDGTTLLGADDKAGVAEIMAMAEYLLTHPEVPHGRLCICFTPDEEVGGGTARIDLGRFDPDFAYTVDGGPLGGMEYENFNAASARLVLHGRSIHPGSAKNRMINSQHIAMEFCAMLPPEDSPNSASRHTFPARWYSENASAVNASSARCSASGNVRVAATHTGRLPIRYSPVTSPAR